jgi:two-component system, NtrC family, response regulator HydG
MRPTKLSSNVFLELPPVLAHYLSSERNVWLESRPNAGSLSLLNRTGVFRDLESLAIVRKHTVDLLGFERARALWFRIGFEEGRRNGNRHYQLFDENMRLALQAGPVFGQLEGRYRAEPVRFEFDLDEPTLYREIVLHDCTEALAHRMAFEQKTDSACWLTAGWLSGHISEIVGRRVLTLEQGCLCSGESACRFVSRLDTEWGPEANWLREALTPESLERELARRDETVAAAQRAAQQAQRALSEMNRRLRTDLMFAALIAESDVMQPVLSRAEQVIRSQAPAVIVGERGVGKETLARAIHHGGPRRNGTFVIVDCLGLSEGMLLQELRGFAAGAVPGAAKPYVGAFVRAHGGTLYLNEVSAMPMDAQGVLARALEEGAITPIGAEEPVRADVRVLAGTSEAPAVLVGAGRLREDLFYILRVARLDIPPLRERETDILRLADYFLQAFRRRYERPGLEFSESYKRALLECAWPGNIRQLRNAIEHSVVMCQDDVLDLSQLPEDVLASRWTRRPQELTPEVVQAALRRTQGNRTKAAELLGVGRTTLWRALKRTTAASPHGGG